MECQLDYGLVTIVKPIHLTCDFFYVYVEDVCLCGVCLSAYIHVGVQVSVRVCVHVCILVFSLF